MTVYKGYLKIVKQNKALILLYLVIFLSVTIMFQGAAKGENYSSYEAESVKIALVDEDGGALADGLRTYLSKFHEITMMENNPEVLQENLFYRNVEYIIHIPKGFFENCIVGGEKLPVTKVPGAYTSFYVDQQINSYLNNVRTYYAAGFSETEASRNAAEMKRAEVNMLDHSGTTGEMPGFGFYFRYIPFLFLSVLCYVMGNMLAAFRKGDLPKRMQASAISVRRQNLEGLLAAGTVALALWIFSIGGAVIFYQKELIGNGGLPYLLLNTLMVLLVALSVSYLVGILSKNANTLSGIVNTLSLGMCFLCGVFVPLSYMNKTVTIVSMFLPVYWYERANELILDAGTPSGAIQTEIFQAIGIQFIFSIALVCITLAVSKARRRG
ncbi:MAG: ABC transporter permease [Clostridia bacterium]|nr:ABC transporter permease [Lachnospiraceae bacterium]NCB99895.1 ABC transporter permease [Clostridia bacterium]NCD03080.1 ABC transporter permease [Clostridia bacterium]